MKLKVSVLAALSVVAANAQAPRRVTLGPPIATAAPEFSQIANMRELSDGRLLVTDFNEQSITVVDFKSNTAKVVGRKGDGPGEYALVTKLLPFGGDTTLMPMEMAMRWTVITPDLKFSTISPDAPYVAMVRTNLVYGTDNAGHVLTTGNPRRAAGITRDTSPLLLIDRRSMKVDTIGRTDGGAAPRQQGAARQRLRAYSGYDRVLMDVNGWVAVVRHAPYRVEWRSPAGQWTIGKLVSDPPVRMNDAEKKAFLDRRAAARANASTKRISAPGAATLKEGAAPPPPPDYEFPDVIPPFAASPVGLLLSPQGYLLVPRNVSLANPDPFWDVFDRQGNRLYQLTMPKNQTPLAFGASSLYVVNTDDDGLQKISRHAWPIPTPTGR
jgi:hypothetical protein